MTPTHINIGYILKTRRLAIPLTIQQLAKRAGYSYQVITNIERGKTNFIFNTLVNLCQALSLPMNELFVTADTIPVNPMQKKCKLCGKFLFGRADKSYCDTVCKSQFHNEKYSILKK